MEKPKLNSCPICTKDNSIKTDIVQEIENIKRIKCFFCGCIYFSDNDYLKPVYDIDYNMNFFRAGDIRKAGIVAYILDEILKSQIEDKKILEIGTGNGLVTFLMTSMGYDITALDLDLQLCMYLRKNMNIPVIQGEFEKVELQHRYDLMYASHVIEHVTDPIAFLQKAKDNLAEGGLIYIDTPSMTFQEKHGIDWKHFETRNAYEHCCLFYPKTIEFMANILGFRVMQLVENKQYESMQITLRKE